MDQRRMNDMRFEHALFGVDGNSGLNGEMQEVKTLLKGVDEKLDDMANKVVTKDDLEGYVTTTEFRLIQRIVYGFVGLIRLAFASLAIDATLNTVNGAEIPPAIVRHYDGGKENVLEDLHVLSH